MGLSVEGKREMTSFMGSVNAKTRDILQVRLTGKKEQRFKHRQAYRKSSDRPYTRA